MTTPQITIGRIGAAYGKGEGLFDLTRAALCDFGTIEPKEIGGVVAASFSSEKRFPSLAVRVAAELGLPVNIPAFDLQMACSAYPYAVYVAGRLASDVGKKVLVIDGDVQSKLVDVNDHATGNIFSDAVTVSEVSAAQDVGSSRWTFLSRYDEALSCSSVGPIRMDGMKVFSFVATEVSRWLREFIGEHDFNCFVPHQANAYMIRQLAKSLGLDDCLKTLPETIKNPGSCSIPLTIRHCREHSALGPTRALIAGFGAGYSAAAGVVGI